MSKEVLESLKESIREAGAIMRGEEKPSREFIRERTDERLEPEQALAICLSSDDEELLIPGKIYEVKLLGDDIGVIDEADEMVICPAENFILVHFDPKVEQILRNSLFV